jgi:ribosome-binding protein aMBF1 (putative translation factor)
VGKIHCRKSKSNTSVSVISRYERDEMTPSIDVAKKLATILHTTVGYLLDETEQENVLKDPDMFKRLNDIEKIRLTRYTEKLIK